MSHELFELYVTQSGVRKFVQDWIQTKASLWKDVQVSIVEYGELYSVLVRVTNNTVHGTYVRDTLFGKNGELTKKFWLAIYHET